MKAVVTDIEGGTFAPAFVRDVLVPYARRRLPVWLVAHKQDPEVAVHVEALRLGTRLGTLAEVAATLVGWMDAGREHPSLDALRRRVWAEGCRDGSLGCPVYPDVPRALRRWRDAGLAVVSCGAAPAEAQSVLLAHTDHGDLTACITAWVDTRARGPAVYRAIAEAMGAAPGDVLFVSCDDEALDAAAAAGLATTRLVREGSLDSGARRRQVASLADIAV